MNSCDAVVPLGLSDWCHNVFAAHPVSPLMYWYVQPEEELVYHQLRCMQVAGNPAPTKQVMTLG